MWYLVRRWALLCRSCSGDWDLYGLGYRVDGVVFSSVIGLTRFGLGFITRFSGLHRFAGTFTSSQRKFCGLFTTGYTCPGNIGSIFKNVVRFMNCRFSLQVVANRGVVVLLYYSVIGVVAGVLLVYGRVIVCRWWVMRGSG